MQCLVLTAHCGHVSLCTKPIIYTSSEHPASCLETPYKCHLMQTYEGGLGGEPGNEAHGGYTYCGLAALMLAGSTHVLHLPRLLHWAVHCQARLALLRGCTSWRLM